MTKELREILDAWTVERSQGRACALATVVRVVGSSYRQPGARMLVSERGVILAGCISGGCLEADVVEWSREVLASDKLRLLTYDTLSEEPGDLLFGLGTGCEGIIEVLVERLAGDSPSLAIPETLLEMPEAAVLATVYRSDDSSRIGGRLLMRSDGHMGREGLDDAVMPLMASAARRALHTRESANGTVETAAGRAEIFCEYLPPPIRLILCGAGPDAPAVVRMASEMGWEITVADHRAAYAAAPRFPSARCIVVTRPEDLLDRVSVDERCAVVAMTHSYLLDRDLLTRIARTSAFYVGLLGSRKRLEMLMADLRASSGVDAREALGARFHAPIGLDLGASSPEQIALSIIAEIQAASSGHKGGFLSSEASSTQPSIRRKRLETARMSCPISA